MARHTEVEQKRGIILDLPLSEVLTGLDPVELWLGCDISWRYLRCFISASGADGT